VKICGVLLGDAWQQVPKQQALFCEWMMLFAVVL